MSQFYSGADLKRGALLRAGEPTDGSSEYDHVALKYLNQLYFGIVSGSNEFDVDCGEVWTWAKSTTPIILNLRASYGEDNGGGTVSVVNGNASCSFSTPPSYSVKDQYLWVDDQNPEKYRIIDHDAGDASFTLDSFYNGNTNTAVNFRILNIVYALGTENDILRLVEPFRVYKMTFDEDRDYQIYGLDSNSFHKNYPLSSIVSGVPNRFMSFKNGQSQICVQMNQWVSESIRVEIDFIPPPLEITDSDQSVPLIPRAFRSVLEFGATAFLMMDKNDDRATSYVQLTTAKLKALVEATRKEQSQINSKSKGALFPRQEELRVRQRLQTFVRQNN